jgi:hypothetical protein
VANDKQLSRAEHCSGDTDPNGDSGGNATADYPNSDTGPDNAKATNTKTNGYAHPKTNANPYTNANRNSLSVATDGRVGDRSKSSR